MDSNESTINNDDEHQEPIVELTSEEKLNALLRKFNFKSELVKIEPPKKPIEQDSMPKKRDDAQSPLSEKDIETLKNAFEKVDKKKTGSIKPAEVSDVFRLAGQNPTEDEVKRMNQEADEPGTGMVMFSEMIPIVEKYWKNYENYVEELKEACLAFDRNDVGLIEFEDLKKILMKYGEVLDDDDMELFEKSVNLTDGKIIVDEFIKLFSPLETEQKKPKAKKGSGKKTKGSVKTK